MPSGDVGTPALFSGSGRPMIWKGSAGMSTSLKDLIQAFRDLPDSEKHELAAAVLRWESGAAHPRLVDDELLANAEAVFLALDRDEERDE